MPGEVGRILIQTYFEAKHSDTAVIHPDDKSPVSPPEPIRRSRRIAPPTSQRRIQRFPSSGVLSCHEPRYSAHPLYGPITRAVASPPRRAPPSRQQYRPRQVNINAQRSLERRPDAALNQFFPDMAAWQSNGSATGTSLYGQRAPFIRFRGA